MRTSLIVAAGGSGQRFQKGLKTSHPAKNKRLKSAPSKLFSTLRGEPLLLRTLKAFRTISDIREIIVALPEGAEREVRKWTRQDSWPQLRLIRGGSTRAESVWKALKKVDRRNPWVMVHDGARPFISRQMVRRLIESASNCDGAILARKVVPTIKETNAAGFILRTIDRRSLSEAETPQLVNRKILERAYRENPEAYQATDEASLLESIGSRVKVVFHEGWNPKITSVSDLEMAEAVMAREKPVVPITGLGKDFHRLVKGRPLILGGIRVPSDKGSLGHSDGDALLHAVTDAILGVTGGGDIGEWFSDKDPKNKNISSRKMISAVQDDAEKDGWSLDHVDTVICLERPKLGPYKKKIVKSLSTLLRMDEKHISVKAKTMEGLGPEGEGKAISCEAIVTMRRQPL